MKLTYENLNRLPDNLASVYFITGDEFLLADQARDFVIQQAQKQHYDELLRFHPDAQFDWQIISNHTDNLSLFSQKKIILIDLRQNKLSESMKNFMKDYLSQPRSDVILIVLCSKLDKASQNTAWYKGIEDQGVVIQLWPLTEQQLPRWIQKQCQSYQLALAPAAVQCLIESNEGNLLAIKQALEKLQLANFSGVISVEQIQQITIDQSQYDIFQWVDFCLLGDEIKALKSLQRLQQQAAEPVLLLWALTQELRHLHKIQFMLDKQMPLTKAYGELRIWPKKQMALTTALKRRLNWQNLLLQAHDIDCIIKGSQVGDVFLSLQQLTLAIMGKTLWTHP